MIRWKESILNWYSLVWHLDKISYKVETEKLWNRKIKDIVSINDVEKNLYHIGEG